jgi:hypothetical protein
MATVPTPSPEYVADYENTVPVVLRICGGESIVFHEATDEVVGAVFALTRTPGKTASCIHEALPQVHFTSPAEEWK